MKRNYSRLNSSDDASLSISPSLRLTDDSYDSSTYVVHLNNINSHSVATTGKGKLEHDDADSNSDDLQVAISRKRPSKNYIWNVPKTDIRRVYPIMFANCFNKLDPGLTYSFFSTYTNGTIMGNHDFSEVNFNAKQVPENGTGHLASPRNKSLEMMLLFYSIMAQLNPDECIRLRKGYIKTRFDSKISEIICDVAFEFTRIYDTNPMELTEQIIADILLNNSDYLNQMKSSYVVATEEDASVNDAKSSDSSVADDEDSTVNLDDNRSYHSEPHKQQSSTSGPTSVHAPKSRKKMTMRTLVREASNGFRYPDTLSYYYRMTGGKTLALLEVPEKTTVYFTMKMQTDEYRRLMTLDFADPRFTP